MRKKIVIWIDDIRNPYTNDYQWVREKLTINPESCNIIWLKTYQSFINHIEAFGLPDVISFDHDLGLNQDGTEQNGLDCAKYLVDYCLNNNKELTTYINVHSSNPVGAESIKTLLKNYQNFYEQNKK